MSVQLLRYDDINLSFENYIVTSNEFPFLSGNLILFIATSLN